MDSRTTDKRVLIIAGGSVLRSAPIFDLFDLVIAADSGVDSAYALGFDPDVAIGDFDSISPVGLARLRQSSATILQSPTDKDATDTELALAHASEVGASDIVLLSPGGGRLDHAHGILCALTHPQLAHVRVEAVIGTAHVVVIHGRAERSVPRRGSHLVALHAMNGTARGVRTDGLRWNLRDEDLEPWISRGVSNEMTDAEANVLLQSGTLLVVQPDAYASIPNDNPPTNGETR